MEDLPGRILTACRTELCGLYPGLNGAFACLPQKNGAKLGTDGAFLYVPDAIVRLYAHDPAAVRRGYLHMLLHCLYLHIRVPDRVDPKDWGLACDLWTEKFMEELHQSRLSPSTAFQKELFAKVRGTPWDILKQLPGLPYERAQIQKAVAFDDHSLWTPDLSQELCRRWEGLGSSGQGLGAGNRGKMGGSGEQDTGDLKGPLYDFRRYLRRYTVPKEELEPDEESFDYIPYHLGMTLYGNMPLLEPLEYKEVRRLDALAIAIDTSASCDKALVNQFLRETYGIFSAQENFFRNMQVVFFQCDCCLQDKTLVRSPREWEDYGKRLKIKGRGGTDFTPVFREIQAMRERRELPKPRALLYFTDGDGVYPHRPDYETVFILAGPKKQRQLVPQWACVLELE